MYIFERSLEWEITLGPEDNALQLISELIKGALTSFTFTADSEYGTLWLSSASMVKLQEAGLAPVGL